MVQHSVRQHYVILHYNQDTFHSKDTGKLLKQNCKSIFQVAIHEIHVAKTLSVYSSTYDPWALYEIEQFLYKLLRLCVNIML